MKLYITPLGKTASLQKDPLVAAKKQFNFDKVVGMTSDKLYFQIVSKLNKVYPDVEVSVYPISAVYSGNRDYYGHVQALASIVTHQLNKGDEVILNSSGGTEKMSCIIKDVKDILRHRGIKVTHVFGTVDIHTKEVLFTEVPEIDAKEEEYG